MTRSTHAKPRGAVGEDRKGYGTQKNDDFIKEKEVKCPISVSLLGLTEPSQNIGESLWQVLNPEDQVVKVRPGVDVGSPLQSVGHRNNKQYL